MKHVLQARGHEMELMGREKALAEALAVPVSPILSFSLTHDMHFHSRSSTVQVRLASTGLAVFLFLFGCHDA